VYSSYLLYYLILVHLDHHRLSTCLLTDHGPLDLQRFASKAHLVRKGDDDMLLFIAGNECVLKIKLDICSPQKNSDDYDSLRLINI
jgi:hypothetical protein